MGLFLTIFGMFILGATQSKIGDVVGLSVIGVGLAIVFIREITAHRGE